MSRLTRLVRSLLYPVRSLSSHQTIAQSLPSVQVDELAPFAGLPSQEGPSYAVSRAVALLLAGLVQKAGCRNVLEFGAGTSSRVLARTLSFVGGGRLTSVEQSPEWCRQAWADVLACRGVDSALVVASPEVCVDRTGVFHMYASARRVVAERGAYDLAFIDAPQWYYGRDGALPLIYDLLSPGAMIVLDDAGRSQERWAIRRWLQVYAGLELVAFDGAYGRNGVAVFRFTGNRRRRTAVGPWFSGGAHLAAGWATRRVRGLRISTPGGVEAEPVMEV